MKLKVTTAHVTDFDSIRLLYNMHESKFFGPPLRKHRNATIFFQDYMTHRLAVRSEESYLSVIGYAEFNICPNIPALPRECWTNWLNYHYCTQLPISISNTIYFQYFLFHEQYSAELLFAVLEEFFLRETKIRYILTVQPPRYNFERPEDVPFYEVLEKYSTILYPGAFGIKGCQNTQRIHLITRDHIWSNMRYRRALPEDNDDILEIIDRDYPHLRETWGDYYVAEELLREDENAHSSLIVGESNNITVGFVWLNDDVDVMHLAKNYEAEMYGNLVRFMPQIPFRESVIPVRMLRPRPDIFTTETVHNLFGADDMTETHKVPNALKGELSAFTLSSVFQMARMEASSSETASSIKSNPFEGIFYKFLLINQGLHSANHYLVELTKDMLVRYNPYDLTMHKGRLGSIRATTRDVFQRNRNSMIANAEEREAKYPVEYNSNAFAVQLFGMHESMDDRRAFQFLIAAFSAFPLRDYCLVSVDRSITPSGKFQEFLKFFSRMVPRPSCPIEDKVFIAHRSSICGDLSLHPIREEDLPEVRYILASSNKWFIPPNLETEDGALFPGVDKTTEKNVVEEQDEVESSDRDSRESSISSTGSATMDAGDGSSETSPIQSELQRDIEYADSVMLKVFKALKKDPYNDYNFFTIRCGNSSKPTDFNIIVGFIILRKFYQMPPLNTYFTMHRNVAKPDSRIAEIIMLKLHPLLSYQSDMVFREMARILDTFDFVYFQPIKSSIESLPNDLVTNMQPIEPKLWRARFRKTYAVVKHRPVVAEIERMNYGEGNFAAFQTNLLPAQFFGNPKTIVIYGFGPESKAFLRVLLFCWNGNKSIYTKSFCCLPRLKVIVISKPGVVAGEYDNTFRCNYCEKQDDCWVNYNHNGAFVRDVTQRMDLRHYVTFVTARLRRIDRSKRVVILGNGCEVYYDQLLLLCSLDFSIPKELHANADMPPNYAHINTRLDRIIVYYKIQVMLKEMPNPDAMKILIYGRHVRCFSFIDFLVTHGVKPNCITVVLPYEPADKNDHINNAYEDENIETILQQMVEDMGVKLMHDLQFHYWQRYYEDECLSDVVFQEYKTKKEVVVPCDFFVTYFANHIDMRVADVLKSSHIDVDHGKILVDEKFRTNDPNIYAVGKNIKHRVEPNHQYTYVNAREFAYKLMEILNLRIDGEKEPDEKFSRPSFFQAQLPMGYYMAKTCLPKRYLLNHLNNDYSNSMTTYDGNFVRVRLNFFGIVEEITCVTRKRGRFDYLMHFVGKHEALLNNMKMRYKLNEFASFLDFFSEPWIEPLMCEGFSELHEKNLKLIRPSAEKFVKTQLDRETRKEMIGVHVRAEELETVYLNYIRKNRGDFVHEFAVPEDFDDLH